jgi:hypothetical protein
MQQFFASDVCKNASYSHRIDDKGGVVTSARSMTCTNCTLIDLYCSAIFLPIYSFQINGTGILSHDVLITGRCVADHFNFCTVPEAGADAIFFASLSLFVACLLRGRLSALYILLAGKHHLQQEPCQVAANVCDSSRNASESLSGDPYMSM